MALLRKFGAEFDRPIDFGTLLMFEGGLSNEDLWSQRLTAAGIAHKREDQIATSWKTTNDTVVSGRPDIVICEGADETPTLGIELKELSSLWTIRDVMFGRLPKTAHLCQAMHYAWQLGVPYKLAYTSRSVFATGYGGRGFPQITDPDAKYCEYNDKGQIKNVRPIMIVFDLVIDSKGRLRVKPEEEVDSWATTSLSVQGLKEYYEAVSQMEADNDLGPRPSKLTAFGDEQGYSICDYCNLQECCARYEKAGVQKWLDAVRAEYKNPSCART